MCVKHRWSFEILEKKSFSLEKSTITKRHQVFSKIWRRKSVFL